MPRFMVEVNRRAYGRLEAIATEERRTPKDQAGVMLEQLLEAQVNEAVLEESEAPIE